MSNKLEATHHPGPAPRHISFTVDGIPIPQGSKSAFAVRNKEGEATGQVNVTEGNKKLPGWRRAVRDQAKKQTALPAGPVVVQADFYLPRPKAHYRTGKFSHLLKDTAPKYHLVKPDVDKLIRGVLDALTMAGSYTDDNQVVTTIGNKHWADQRTAGAHITALVIGDQP